MKPSNRFKLQKYSTFVGCCLLLLPTGQPWYWGNLSPYTDSYSRVVHGIKPVSDSASWLLAVSALCFSLGMILDGILKNHLKESWITCIGILLYGSGLFLSSLAVKSYVWVLCLTAGAQIGLARGVITGQALATVVEWSSENVAFWTSVVMSSINVGAMLINQFVTHYINPNNKAPRFKEGTEAYFTDKDILHRVPKMFCVFGAFVFGVHFIGFKLIEKPPGDHNRITSVNKDTNDYFPISSLDSNADMSEGNKVYIPNGNNAIDDEKESCSIKTKENVGNPRDMTSLEMIQCSECYVLIYTTFASYYAAIMLSSYSKTFGQLWISDDHLLSNAGTVSALVALGGRVSWGVMIDRAGFKMTLICYHASLSVVAVFWCFAPLAGPRFYFIWVSLFGMVNIGFTFMVSMATLKLFGKTHCNKNAGIIKTVGGVISLADQFVSEVLLHGFGWYAMYFSGAIINAVGIVIVLIGIPET